MKEERENVCVCVCVCVRERERNRERERERKLRLRDVIWQEALWIGRYQRNCAIRQSIGESLPSLAVFFNWDAGRHCTSGVRETITASTNYLHSVWETGDECCGVAGRTSKVGVVRNIETKRVERGIKSW